MNEYEVIDKTLVSRTKFLKMPLTTQALYFHLAIHAGDERVIEPYPIIRTIGALDGDLQLLIDKGYIGEIDEDTISIL